MLDQATPHHRTTEASSNTWDAFYRRGVTPWRSAGLGRTTRNLLQEFTHPDRLLEIGCGLGDDASGLIEMGYSYHGVDFSAAAVQDNIARQDPNARLEEADFFVWQPTEPYAVAYDKGLFHGLEGESRRLRLTERTAHFLRPGGVWVSVCGAADHRRQDATHGAIYLTDFVSAVEPYFEILEVRKAPYGVSDPNLEFEAWHIASRRR